MSVEFAEEEKKQACEYLQNFTSDHSNPFSDDDPLPIRISTLTLCAAQDEIEGECLHWTLEYLRKSKAPRDLMAIISRQVVNEVLEKDVSTCEQIDKAADNKQSELDISKLARVVFSKVHEVCKYWSQELPALCKSNMQYDVSVHAIKNTRRKMEDRHVIITDFNAMFAFPKDFPSQAFFAVYDGHGGADAANYASTHLHCHLARNLNYREGAEDGVIPTALAEAFWKTDEAFGIKARKEGLKCGTTGLTALIHGDKLYIAWLGDSQAILSKGGQFFSLMEPHKPERQDEKERIESLGGCVVWFGAWRVNGSLSVSRAIGDIEHKPYICGNPDVIEYEFDGDEEFLILACDGLWDVMKPECVIALVHKLIADGTDRTVVAKELVTYAAENGSSDNISVVVVYLDGHKKENAVTSTDTPVLNDVSLTKAAENGLKDKEHTNGDVAADICCSDEKTSFEKIDTTSSLKSTEQQNLKQNELVNDSSERKRIQESLVSSTSPNRSRKGSPHNVSKPNLSKGNPKLNEKSKTELKKTKEGQLNLIKTKKESTSTNQLVVKGRVTRSKSAPDAFRAT